MPPANVSIVIPTWNGRRILERFLPSVVSGAAHYAFSSGAAVEIVVVDDGSSDDTADWLDAFASESRVPIRRVAHERNRGFGEACNTGMRAAQHDLAFLLNNDVEIQAATIAPLVAHFDRVEGNVFAVHCQAIDLSTGIAVGRGQAGGFRRGFIRVHDSFMPGDADAPPFFSIFASGGAAMFDRRRFLELGGFDPIFAPFYYEDVELSYRAWKRGLTVIYEPSAVIRHQFSSTIGAAGRARIRRISHRNRLLFHWIHLHDRRWLAAHLTWLPLVTLTSLLTLRPALALGAFAACRSLQEARRLRARERALATRSDREVVKMTAGTKKRPA